MIILGVFFSTSTYTRPRIPEYLYLLLKHNFGVSLSCKDRSVYIKYCCHLKVNTYCESSKISFIMKKKPQLLFAYFTIVKKRSTINETVSTTATLIFQVLLVKSSLPFCFPICVSKKDPLLLTGHSTQHFTATETKGVGGKAEELGTLMAGQATRKHPHHQLVLIQPLCSLVALVAALLLIVLSLKELPVL